MSEESFRSHWQWISFAFRYWNYYSYRVPAIGGTLNGADNSW